jgi:hypothetical protein
MFIVFLTLFYLAQQLEHQFDIFHQEEAKKLPHYHTNQYEYGDNQILAQRSLTLLVAQEFLALVMILPVRLRVLLVTQST